VNVLNTIVFDLGRFGIQFVASPRHADGLLITGPVTGNMRLLGDSAPVIVLISSTAISLGGPPAARELRAVA
jgi:Ni,Fe-hydrogenase III small subunit